MAVHHDDTITRIGNLYVTRRVNLNYNRKQKETENQYE